MATYEGPDAKGGITEDEVHRFLGRFTELYERADDGFFDLFAPDATVFSVSSSQLLDGREAFRKSFEPQLKREGKRTSEIFSPEVRVLGNTALVSYRNRIGVEGKQIDLRGSLVLSKDRQGGLKVSHLHNSTLPGAQPAPAGLPLEEVVVLEERVATALSTIGTPK